MSQSADYTNHLAGETSPYLLQHARNPVDWHPWGAAALEKARRERKPILLSIGYSACHWCHVMAHESFEDPATAAQMNAQFVNVKVDREERPDLDKIYQTAHSLLNRRPGGWPLTVFLTADDQTPFFAGTYFPAAPRHGLPAFREVLQRITDYLATHPDQIQAQNRSLIEALHALRDSPVASDIHTLPLDSARQLLEQTFDEQHGGFGAAPKFPHPTSLEYLLRHWAGSRGTGAEPDRRALHMVTFTLDRMAQGGVFDQVGGGFCRYSVDGQWLIPHFEKMLYDNGALLALYAEAWAATRDPLYERVCRQTADWVLREMQDAAGGYCSSLDADSEGEEGRYYVWTPDEVRTLLAAGDYQLCARHFGLDGAANFAGRWHLSVHRTVAELAAEYNRDASAVAAAIEQARTRLLEARRHRIGPGRDDKVLTAWNGLMIRGMAVAARHLDEPAWAASAQHALDFIRTRLWHDGRLLATWKDGRARFNAYLDDYVYLIDAILELQQVRWRDGELDFALALAEVVLARFRDPAGGFYFTSDDHEQLLERPRVDHDEATPAGNGIAAKVFGRLGRLLAEPRYLQAAEDTLRHAWSGMESMPHVHASLLVALEELLLGQQCVIIRGQGAPLETWRRLAASDYGPRRLTLALPDHAQSLPDALAARAPTPGQTTAYVCSGTACSPPVTDRQAFANLLAAPAGLMAP
ncbi:MAG: thioredoxin domain-containing protein [Pseudomonadota bacterium]